MTFVSDFWTLETGGCSMSDADLDDQRGEKLGRRQGWRETKSKTERALSSQLYNSVEERNQSH